jgi:hypothetical protein
MRSNALAARQHLLRGGRRPQLHRRTYVLVWHRVAMALEGDVVGHLRMQAFNLLTKRTFKRAPSGSGGSALGLPGFIRGVRRLP